MSIKVTPINNEVHAKTKVRKSNDFSHLAEEQLIPVTMHEFPQAASEFPVFFIKDGSGDRFHAVALMGLKQKQNLYCQGNDWQANYMPAILRHHPFSLTIENSDDKAYLCIEESSDRVNEEEGIPLFNEKGEETEFLKDAGKSLTEYMHQTEVTKNVIQLLVKHELLASMNLSLNNAEGESIKLNGIYTVDIKKLEELPQEDFLKIKDQGLLLPIYAHHNSLHQTHRLARKQLELEKK